MTKLEQKKQDELLLISYMAGGDATKKHFDSRSCETCRSSYDDEHHLLACRNNVQDIWELPEGFSCSLWSQKDA